jgi:hypothetical protein
MQLKTKKKIAKEVLLLLSSGIITLIIFLLVYPFNWYCNYKSEGIQTLIMSKTIQSDSLIKHYNSKLKQQQWFYEGNIKDFDLEYNSYSELWHRLEVIYNADSIEYKYINTWDKSQIALLNKLGFRNANDFKEFIAKNRITEADKANRSKSDEIKKEISKLNSEKRFWELKAMTKDEQMGFAIKALIIVLIFLYPIRFLYWLIVWSFNTLKQKGE